MTKALVTGGTGFIGSHMVELLLAEGWQVVCPVRNPKNLRNLEGLQVDIIQFDRLQKEIGLIKDTDYVFHIGGATRGINYDDYRSANVDLTRMLLEFFDSTISNQLLKRFVLVSSQASVGPSPDNGEPVTEEHSAAPLSMYGRSKLEAERIAATFMGGLPITVVRPPTVFGPRDTDVLGVFKCACYRFAPCIAGPDRLVSIIYVKDLVRGILAAARSDLARGSTYFLSNPEPVVWREFALRIARVMGCRAVMLPVPISIMKLASLAGEFAGRITGEPSLLRTEKFEEMKQLAWVCSANKALQQLNWQPDTPLDNAIQETAKWYEDHGWI
jgi:nucleoside-diphosphate-sugar epimerase